MRRQVPFQHLHPARNKPDPHSPHFLVNGGRSECLTISEVKSKRVLFLLQGGLFLHPEFLTKCDFKMLIAAHSPQVLSQSRSKRVGISYATVLGSMGSYLALQFVRDFRKDIVPETAQ